MKKEKLNNATTAGAISAVNGPTYDQDEEMSKVREILANMTLFDDDLMSKVFDKNIEATELMLSIILNQPIKVISSKGQYDMKSSKVKGRNIRLDIFAKDAIGQYINVEVQGNREGAHIRRARYNSAMMDSRMLKANQPYKDMKDSYTIFMYHEDMFGLGFPLYHIDRYIRESMQPVSDGNHIIYVNGQYKGDDRLGKLISDFNQKDGNKMHYKALAESVKHFKEEEVAGMCDSVKIYGDEREARGALSEKIAAVKKIIDKLGTTLEEALDILDIRDDDRIAVINALEK